jgi:phosphoglycerol transferase MdoB-like AlkP superfamily enzyme
MPSTNGTVFVSYWDREYISIPKLVKEQGYYAFSMHGNKGDMWNRTVMHKQLGYDRFYSKTDYTIDDVIGLGLSDKSFFRQSIPKIKAISEQHDKYFGTLIMLSNHTPFSDTDKYGDFPVSETVTKPNDQGVEEQVTMPYMEGTDIGNYIKSVHYADAALGELMDGLDKEGLLDNTVIVIYGDHDARLPKNDYVRLYNYDPYTDSVKDETDPTYKPVDYYDYELNRKVPLIVWSKDNNKAINQEVTKVMGMYDVEPTIGNMFGFSSPYALGHDIFSVDNNMVVFANGNWLTQDVYYNSQKQEFKLLNANAVITQDYINKYDKIAGDKIDVSNGIILYDYIRKSKESQQVLQNKK